MIQSRSITTAEQLLCAGDIGRCELVRGELIMMSPANPEHARLVARLTHALMSHMDRHPGLAAEVWSGDPGFLIRRNPDTVRAPDVALIRRDRVLRTPPHGFFPGAPDLAVEVLSPGDAAGEVRAKVQDWLEAGVIEVWVVDPQRKTVAIHRRGADVQMLGETDDITAGDVLPGFRAPVAELFR